MPTLFQANTIGIFWLPKHWHVHWRSDREDLTPYRHLNKHVSSLSRGTAQNTWLPPNGLVCTARNHIVQPTRVAPHCIPDHQLTIDFEPRKQCNLAVTILIRGLGPDSSSSSRIHSAILIALVSMNFLYCVAEGLNHHAAILQPLVLSVGVEVPCNDAQHAILIHMECHLHPSSEISNIVTQVESGLGMTSTPCYDNPGLAALARGISGSV